jgi:UDP-GlcNAc:undecaprenyl-phosphate/decaprenyl-phosphate GlcNAc-1-phosphate transferase
MTYLAIVTALVAMGVTWTLTPLVIRLAEWLGAVDRPGGRRTHSQPTPRIGGLAVFLGFVAGLAAAAFFTGSLWSLPRVSVYWRGMVVAATFLLVVGAIDDVRGITFRGKFAAQAVAAAAVWWCGFRIEILSNPFGGPIDLGPLSFPVTVLWIVGITNAVNLIDGLDGLAAGIALITTASVGLLAYVRGEFGVAAASLALAGSLVGFLRFNFSPARIFLGDSGSLFLGFVLAVTSVRGSQKGATAVAILAPLLVLGLPLLDTGLAIVRRMYRLTLRGRATGHALRYVVRNLDHVFQPDREHIHHRLLDLGFTHRNAVLLLYGIGVLFAAVAYGSVLSQSMLVGLVLVSALVGAMALFVAALYLRLWSRARPARPEESAPPSSSPPLVETVRAAGGPGRSG